MQAHGLNVTQPATGISLSVETSGTYTVTTSVPTWTFAGNLDKTLSELAQTSGEDKLGAYTGITFKLTGTGPLLGTIRIYAKQPVVMFSMKTLAPMGTLGVTFPDITTYPKTDMYYCGQIDTMFAVPTFTLSQIDDNSPLVSFNASAETFIYSAADHFWEVSNTYTNALRSTVKNWATPIPSGWDHQAILAVGKGINAVFNAWGEGLRGYYGKPLPSNEAEIPLKKIGFWTDHFAYYYYKVDPPFANYEEQLVAVRDYYKNTHKLPLGYMMLDSWWYKKGCNQRWNDMVGIYLYQASPQVFPSGLNGFYKKLGIPLVTHHRWYEASCSPIAKTYGLSKGLPTKYAAWKEIAYGVGDSGVVTFEQDWLNGNAQVAQRIGDFDSAMGNMALACAEKKMTVQYCMAPPTYWMQAMKLSNVTTIRTVDDGYEQYRWNDHIVNSRFAWSAGMYPWVDCFKSSDKGSLVSAVISAAFFPPSDKMGAEVIANILPATRKDGILIHPDVPALPTDNTMINSAKKIAANPVTVAWTDHGNRLKTCYLWVPGANAPSYSFDPVNDGGMNVPRGVYAYNWFNKSGTFVASGSKLSSTCSAGTGKFDFWIVAPVADCDIAFLGDLSKYASCGRSRVTALSHAATQVTATVDLEPEEPNVTLSGYALTKPEAACSDNATLGPVFYSDNIFNVVLTPKAGVRTPLKVAFGSNPSVGINNANHTYRETELSVSSHQGRIRAAIDQKTDFIVYVYSLDGKLVHCARCLARHAWTSPRGLFDKGTWIVRVVALKKTYAQKVIVM
jgi:hypothetical protein